MNQDSSNKIISIITIILVTLVVSKLTWVVVEKLYLPKHGIELKKQTIKPNLYYRYKLASTLALPKIKKTIKVPIKKKIVSSIDNLKLVAIYSSGADSIVTVTKLNKSYILGIGDNVNGFTLQKTTAMKAFFQRANKEYVLKLFEKKNSTSSYVEAPTKKVEILTNQQRESKKVIVEDGVVSIPRNLLKEYTTDLSKAIKDIGLRPIRNKGKMEGYKVRYVRKGTSIAKLGLIRGDIIKAINGDPIVDLAAPMQLLKSADTIEGLTITIQRRNEEKELEYEIR